MTVDGFWIDDSIIAQFDAERGYTLPFIITHMHECPQSHLDCSFLVVASNVRHSHSSTPLPLPSPAFL